MSVRQYYDRPIVTVFQTHQAPTEKYQTAALRHYFLPNDLDSCLLIDRANQYLGKISRVGSATDAMRLQYVHASEVVHYNKTDKNLDSVRTITQENVEILIRNIRPSFNEPNNCYLKHAERTIIYLTYAYDRTEIIR